MYAHAVNMNISNIKRLLEVNNQATFIDLGCNDGELTINLAESIGCSKIHGVEIVNEARKKAETKGVMVYNFNLNQPFPLPSESYDIVHANQVIEHLTDTDTFLSEIKRILRPKGQVIISTENASSWCNILASILGWQIFSLTNFSSLAPGLGNPFALHRSSQEKQSMLPLHRGSSWNHIRILNYRGLKEYLEAANFRVEALVGAGYFPLPSILGRLDPIHSHFLTIKASKSE